MRDSRMVVSRSRAVEVTCSPTGIYQNVHGVQITGGNLTIAGGDVHHHTHHHTAMTVASSILDLVPNFRGIHIANLSRATQGTGSWIKRWEMFWLWLSPEWFLMILWGSGMPGAGKTILTSIVISILEEYARASITPICICYIYFRYSDHVNMTVRGCLETLVKQTIERHPHCASLFDEVYGRHVRERTQPSEEELLMLLRRFVGTMSITVYALDALDEAPPEMQLELLEKLASLDVKLFVTSRPLKALETHFSGAHHFPIVAQAEDITLHITKEISRSADLRAVLEKADPSAQKEIVASVIQNCGGMFLHASLQLTALRDCTSVYEVEKTLAAFPVDIEDSYLQTWQRILHQTPSKVLLAKKVLLWVLHATSSLTAEALRRAMATCPETYQYQSSRLVPVDTLIGLCHGLVTVEEDTCLVRLIHYTAKDTVERLITGSFPQPHAPLSAVCLARLSDSGFLHTTLRDEQQLRQVLQTEPLLGYAYRSWFIHVQQSLASPLTRRRMTDFAENCHAFPFRYKSVDGCGFFDLLGPLHLLAYFNLPIAFAGTSNLRNPNQGTENGGGTALHLACMQGHHGALKELLELPNILANAANAEGTTALMMASGLGNEDATRLLLDHPDVIVNAVDDNVRTALFWASDHGHKGVATLLLSHPDTNVNVADKWSTTALIRALDEGHDEVAMLLLSHTDVDVNAADLYKQTALRLASEDGHEGVVKLLLAHPQVDVNVEDMNGRTPLSQAAGYGKEDVVRLLLTHPAIQVGTRELKRARLTGHHSITCLLEAFLNHT
ncbi:hypothetical protein BKA70DRAFT_1294877 [Coprinopsis sp. MPI-PUGE-AT-0042]|nr:hypothetical protein BKA70DRAFT_1294877 [Coprinopsis sp. MPI-PUGE-AT-0042]